MRGPVGAGPVVQLLAVHPVPGAVHMGGGLHLQCTLHQLPLRGLLDGPAQLRRERLPDAVGAVVRAQLDAQVLGGRLGPEVHCAPPWGALVVLGADLEGVAGIGGKWPGAAPVLAVLGQLALDHMARGVAGEDVGEGVAVLGGDLQRLVRVDVLAVGVGVDGDGVRGVVGGGGERTPVAAPAAGGEPHGEGRQQQGAAADHPALVLAGDGAGGEDPLGYRGVMAVAHVPKI